MALNRSSPSLRKKKRGILRQIPLIFRAGEFRADKITFFSFAIILVQCGRCNLNAINR